MISKTTNSSSSSKRARVSTLSSQRIESPLIWIQGTGAASTGSILVILARNGYSKEAHTIIGLSKAASLIGRDSDGGLPELWDIMGNRRNNQYNRLRAICLTRGSLSPERARALIKDHNVDVRAKDFRGRTALHHAVGADDTIHKYSNDDKQNKAPVILNLDLIRVIVDAYPESILQADDKDWSGGHLPIYYAIHCNASFDILKFLFEQHPMTLRNLSLEKLSIFTLLSLSVDKQILELPDVLINVVRVIGSKVSEESTRFTTINAGTHSVLIKLCKEPLVKENTKILQIVIEAIWCLTSSDYGIKKCIESGLFLELINLGKEEIIKENAEAIWRFAETLLNIACNHFGKKACIDAKAHQILTTLKCNHDYIARLSVTMAYKSITGKEM